MLGDEAVAVNPKDPRYTKLIGKHVVLLPLPQNKPIPSSPTNWWTPKFGTGCVKVTPAHDPADLRNGHAPQTGALTSSSVPTAT